MDSWQKLFQKPETLFIMVSSGVVGFLAGIANGVIQMKHGGWPGFFRALFVGVLIAIIAGLGTSGYIQSEAARFAIVGVCAIISEDIWQGFKTFGRGVGSDPLGSIARVISAFRGQSSAPATYGTDNGTGAGSAAPRVNDAPPIRPREGN